MRTISVTEGLNELKLYDAKIKKAVNSAEFCGPAKKSSKLIGFTEKDVFKKNAQAFLQSINDMIANRNELKSAIVKSNAETNISVNGKTMTRAEGIERKNSIEYEELLLNVLKFQFAESSNTIDKENKRVGQKIDELLNTFAGKDSDKKLDKDSISAIADPYREQNEFELVDPIDIYNTILKLEDEIDGFKSTIDSVLAVSNATTFIDLSF